MSQQVDLEELTRLRGDEYTYYAGLMIWKAFPALRDELNDTRRWKSNLYQDRCESAYIEVSLFDAAKQALSEVAPDHPFLKGEPPSFGVWEKLSKENDEMRDELVRLRKEMEILRVQNRMWSDALTSKHAHLNEAKGLLEQIKELAFELGDSDLVDRSVNLRDIGHQARAFLASLAGRDKKHKTPCPHCEHPKFYAQAICANCGKFPTSQHQEQPTQGEANNDNAHYLVNVAWTGDNEYEPEWQTLTKQEYLIGWGLSDEEWQDMVEAGAVKPTTLSKVEGGEG